MQTVSLENIRRYSKQTEINKEKISAAMDRAVEQLKTVLKRFKGEFPANYTKNFRYETSKDFNWVSGMLTGCCWLAYKYTGDDFFKNEALKHIDIYKQQAETGERLNNHDTGFIYSPSCVAGYKLTGDMSMRDASLKAANILMEHYDWDNHFIIRSGTRAFGSYRTMVDSMMNIPLFFWAHEQTGDEKFYEAAVEHYRTTIKYLIRDDASSFHHFEFDPITGKPIKGLTFQGYSDSSCWGRGHSWLIYGFPIAYSYTKNEEIIQVHKNISYFYLNKLAENYISYWDFDFTDASSEPRDSSIAAITTCGFLEMYKLLPDDAEQKQIFKNVADAQINALIDLCENNDSEKDGLILHVTHGNTSRFGSGDECAIYGDYFYMEALSRYLDESFIRFW